jgi:hypothetical protein
MTGAQALLIAMVGGSVPCALLLVFARWLVRATLTYLHEQAKVRCPLCKRAAIEAVDPNCANAKGG